MNSELVFTSDLFKDKVPLTKTGFPLARSKIKVCFFENLFVYSKHLFYQSKNPIKRWKGYRLLAVDGTGIRVPNTAENRASKGVHKNQYGAIAACKILAVHDVLNRVLYHVHLHLHSRAVAGLVALHQNFEKLPEDAITIYDRHYCDSLNRKFPVCLIQR